MIVIRVTNLMKPKRKSESAQNDNFDMKVKVILLRVTTLT